ncbi:hypothetical protein [Streptomyces sp. NPDC001530]|uniref:hypothetical protein n=1 Tax=Streptomyces sp. NPDC001530 TaxID=3364582 RepID=UPI0036A4D68F
MDYKITKGWDPAHPLFHVSLKALVRESRTGGSDPRRHWVEPGGRWEPILPLLEQTLAKVGMAPFWGRHAGVIDRADGDGQDPGLCRCSPRTSRQLAGPDASHLFPQTLVFHGRYERFREWVNGEEGARLGLAPIPHDPLNLRILRRTLAVEIAHRPDGLLAAKIQLKHLSVVTTEGYANRPGGAQAKFLAEVGESEHNRNLTLTLQAFRDFQAGRQPAGPGARDLVSFFRSVENELLQDTTAPQIKHSDQEVINLLSQRAGTLHLGIANYCWFIDPDKALCLKLGQTKDRSRPLAGMCDSARCPQATHHPCHRPVWASAAASSRVFIGKIGRSRKAEKSRLTAEAERAEHVVVAIDAALAAATGGVHGQDQ